jgi:cytoskeletal protein CcmA (bactofilin family)
MKSKIFFVFLTATILMMVNISALGITSDDKLINEPVNSTEKNHYIIESNFTSQNDIAGDLIFVGNKLIVNGVIGDNLYSAANSIRVDDNVLGNIVAKGRKVTINGNIGNDVSIFASEIIINGNVYGDVRLFGSQISINSEIIDGDLVVYSKSLDINENVVITGNSYFDYGSNNSNIFFLDIFDYTFQNIIIIFLSFVISGYIIFHLFPVFSHKTIKTISESSWNSLGAGLLTFALIPPLVFILLISKIGFILFFVLTLLFILGSILSYIYIAKVFGDYMLELINKQSFDSIFSIGAGFLFLFLMGYVLVQIPNYGTFIFLTYNFLIILIGIGAVVSNKIESFSR